MNEHNRPLPTPGPKIPPQGGSGTAPPTSKQWSYTFQVWPTHSPENRKAFYALCEMANTSRFCMHSTEEDFAVFRAQLGHHNLTLREIERVPHVEPEGIL